MRARLSALFVLVSTVVACVGLGMPHAVAIPTPQTYTVQLDAAPPVGEPWAWLRMFPGPTLRVHRGDLVNFAWAGSDTPHTATLVPDADPDAWRAANQGPGDPFESPIPDTAVGGDDGELILNPAEVFPSDPTCGTTVNPCAFDGTGILNSGLQFSAPGAEPSFVSRIDAPVGRYSFLCLLHPGMQVRLRVAPNYDELAGPNVVAARAARQVHHAIKVDGEAADQQAQTVTSEPIWGGRTKYFMSAGGFSNGASANEYLDNPLHAKVGDRIRVGGTGEIHTATFPAESGATVPFTISQCEVPGVDPPASSPFDCADPSQFQVSLDGEAITPTASNLLTHPSTFVNSGLLAGPTHFTFIARQPGTYSFICLVHGPEMQSTIVVRR